MTIAMDTPVRTNAQNLARILDAKLPTLLIFEAPRCEPCHLLEPTLKNLAREFAGRVLIVRVEDVLQGDLAARFNVRRVPTLVLWNSGKETLRMEGAADEAALRSHLNYLVGIGDRPAAVSGPSVELPGIKPGRRVETVPASASEKPLVVTDASFEELVLRSPLPVLVDFWAPWCGPCKMISPVVEELGRSYSGRLRVAKINTDENQQRAMRLGIQGIPTLIIFKDGREVDRVVGAAPKGALQKWIEQALKA